MVYNGVMGRTQVYLGDEELALLDRASRSTGASRSELIRRAVRESFGETRGADRAVALRATAGAWKGRSQSGADYVDGVRDDLNKRLRRLRLL